MSQYTLFSFTYACFGTDNLYFEKQVEYLNLQLYHDDGQLLRIYLSSLNIPYTKFDILRTHAHISAH